ncbi:DUF4199 domain-containing protein [Chitinophaga sp. 22620]|uniref:DUF4199 domain-containing protein n=1 Tax=Chitinophaga sp. 22620 TaxID=3453952 RepID=UPI003F83B739
MKKIVFIFGLIAGLIVTTMMLGTTIACYRNEDFQGNMVVGFILMAIAFSMVFVGIKNYRDKYLGGDISFLKALKVGLLITLVASTMYVLVWVVEYYVFIPDFLDKYEISRYKMAGPEGRAKVESEMAMYRAWYKTPFGLVLMTYVEILPMGILITLISALILKRRKNENSSYQRASA